MRTSFSLCSLGINWIKGTLFIQLLLAFFKKKRKSEFDAHVVLGFVSRKERNSEGKTPFLPDQE